MSLNKRTDSEEDEESSTMRRSAAAPMGMLEYGSNAAVVRQPDAEEAGNASSFQPLGEKNPFGQHSRSNPEQEEIVVMSFHKAEENAISDNSHTTRTFDDTLRYNPLTNASNDSKKVMSSYDSAVSSDLDVDPSSEYDHDETRPAEMSEQEAYLFPGWGKTEEIVVKYPEGGKRKKVKRKRAHRPKVEHAATGSPNILYDGRSVKLDPNSPSAPLLGADHHEPSVSDKAYRSVSESEYENDDEWNSGKEPSHKMLGQFLATSICGNDILSSVLYTAGLVGTAAGVWAPLCMLLVIIMLQLFRNVYGEVGTALPLNGGAYNALLNTTSKATASIAAVLTILSYIATGVVSASEAVSYLNTVVSIDVNGWTIMLLALFAVLNLLGISESAVVASVIFAFHVLVLTLLSVVCIVYVGQNGFHMLHSNYNNTLQPSFATALLYGFSASSLGITGFETSANYIEEQKDGVFVKTLRNMLISVAVFNPLLSFFSLCIIDIDDFDQYQAVLLSRMGRLAGGKWLSDLISIDAFIVLSGAVLTSYVGIVGLARRLAGDRCLPEFLLQENSWRHTNHWIIILYFMICTSLYFIVNGQIDTLAGVYSLAFLSVMSLFAVGNMLLKYKRNSLPRQVRASWSAVIVAWIMVISALVITIIRDPGLLKYFLLYGGTTALLFSMTFYRVRALKIILNGVRHALRNHRYLPGLEKYITDWIREINSRSVVFFTRSVRLSVLNKAILYIRENEDTNWVRIVHVCSPNSLIPQKFVPHVRILDSMYPKMRIDAVIVKGEFGPHVVQTVADKFNIPKSMLFITCPSENFHHKLSALGGVRIITHFSKGDVERGVV